MRLQIDQKIELFDGIGSYIKCTIIKINKQVIALKPDSIWNCNHPKMFPLQQLFLLSKKENLNFMIQKLTGTWHQPN